MKKSTKNNICFLFFTLLALPALGQNREDLPMYHEAQQRKAQIINYLDRQLAAYQGLYFKYDSLKQSIAADSVLLRKLQQQEYKQSPTTLQRKEMRRLFHRNIEQ
jgi:hypothetical protein